MAIYRSQIITAASGSVGGLTFLPSRGGMALRGKAIPTNPNTTRQSTIRILHAFLTSYWVERMSRTNRDKWAAFAAHTPTPNALGDPIDIGGIAAWIRTQLPRLQAGLNLRPVPPRRFIASTFTPTWPYTVDSFAQRLIWGFDTADEWVKDLYAAMFVYIGRPQNQSVHSYRGSFRFAGALLGHPFLPPTSPANLPLPFHARIGQKVFYRITVTQADGRYSRPQIDNATVT